VPDDSRREQTRALMATLIELATATSVASYAEALLLVEATTAVAHGYMTLFAEGFFSRGSGTVEDIAARAVEAAGALIVPAAR
jgi:hypothetical protein